MESLSQYIILVVDDEESARLVCLRQLQSVGFTVLAASSGNQAWELLKTRKIDLIFCDVEMPDGDGRSLLARVRTLPDSPPFVFVTASNITKEESTGLGARTLISKPASIDTLLGTARQILGASVPHIARATTLKRSSRSGAKPIKKTG